MSDAGAGGARVLRASWFSHELLAIVCAERRRSSAAGLRILADSDGGTIELPSRVLDFAGRGDEAPGGWLLTTAGRADELGPLLLYDGEQHTALDPDLGLVRCEPDEFAAVCVEAFGESGRGDAASFLAEAPEVHGIDCTASLSARLMMVRDVLRAPMPRTVVEPHARCVLRFERVMAIDDRAFWLSGWIHDLAPEQAQLTAISPEGLRVQPPAGAVSFHARTDVDEAFGDGQGLPNVGFHAYIELGQSSHHPDGWILELCSTSGAVVEDAARSPVSGDRARLERRVLDPVRRESYDELVLERQVAPALDRLRANGAGVLERVVDFGAVPESPAVSIVVAVSDVDLIAHQLLGYIGDAEIGEAELIYVVPSALGARIAALAPDLHELYRIPFRVAGASAAPTRAQAVNLGASIARGRLLVLLDDDVFADAPGWLGALRETHDARPAVAAVGPKLVFEDGAIADIGIAYHRGRGDTRWERSSPLKGLAGTVAAAVGPRQVQAVSGGCLMIEADRLRVYGGLSELYLNDDPYEVADLSVRLAADGLETWCVPEAQLYRIVSSRWPTDAGPAVQRFNDWRFDRRCGAGLAATRTAAAGAAVERPAPAPAWRSPPLPRAGAPVEVVHVATPTPSDWVLGAALTHPCAGSELGSYANTHSLAIEGWAIAGDGSGLAVEVSDGQGMLAAAPVTVPRRDIAERYPDAHGADTAGFQTVIGTLGLPIEFELEVELVRDGEDRSGLATICGRRRPLRSSFQPALQPLLITTLGRTGSSWLELLLARHPEIVGCRPFVHDARLTSYWTQVLRTLAEPASYMQILRPELYPGSWWTGERRPGMLPLRMAEEHMARWLGGDSVEVAAAFCQSRIEDFYTEVARVERRAGAHYFVEKCWPDEPTLRLVRELYPDGREILLVRDFRDMVCSIFSFNAKRGVASFGREAVESDEQFIRSLRDGARRLLELWTASRRRAHLLRYEDLILEPEATLANACSYLGVAADVDTIRRTIAAANAELPEAQREHRTSITPADSIGRWRNELSEEHRAICDEAFAEVLEAFGYEPEGDSRALAPLPVRGPGSGVL